MNQASQITKPQIKVYITKTKKIRAIIREDNKSTPYEVTVGGLEWQKGRGRLFEDVIKSKALKLLAAFKEELMHFRK